MNRLTIAAVALLCATSAFGQTEKIVQEPDQVVVRTKTSIDFTQVQIDVEITRPSGTYVPVRTPSIFPNLIKIRGSFAPELQKSVDSI